MSGDLFATHGSISDSASAAATASAAASKQGALGGGTGGASAGASAAVLVHQRRRRATQPLFQRNRGRVAAAVFHPTRPIIYVATQRHVYGYDLAKQALCAKLAAGGGPLACLALHPRGGHLLAGGGDRRVAWFDLELGKRPHKTFASHTGPVAGVAFHPRYPLFASASDDATAHVFHGRVYDDLASEPLIVPLRVLRGHEEVRHAGVTALAWHPTQPWLLTAGADGTTRLWVNV